jgi:hypothetical protein
MDPSHVNFATLKSIRNERNVRVRVLARSITCIPPSPANVNPVLWAQQGVERVQYVIQGTTLQQLASLAQRVHPRKV